jgi:predicted transcriptional regulator YdeE
MASEDLKPAKVTIKSEYPKPYTKESWDKLFKKRDSRAANKGGFSVYDKYPRGKGKGKYDY